MSNALNRTLLFLTCLLSLGFLSLSHAQLSANNLYQQCLRFEGVNDLLTAQQSCINALEVNPNFTDASLALARIDSKLGRLGPAETRLRQLQTISEDPEVNLLLASIRLKTQRFGEADSALRRAERQLSATPNQQLEAQLHHFRGQLYEAQGEFASALTSYDRATRLDVLISTYHLAKAQLQFKLGDKESATATIQNYRTISDNAENADLSSLAAKVLWSQGRLAEASSTFETAISQRDLRDPNLSNDLLSLSLSYYGQGNTTAGSNAFREALRRGASILDLLSPLIPWFLIFALLLGLHLWGESQLTARDSLEAVVKPEPWLIGHVYSSLLLSLLAAIVIAFGFSVARFGNFLAILTPLQGVEVKSVFFIAFALTSVILAFIRTNQNGWDSFDKLLGSPSGIASGLGAGLIMLIATIAYLNYLPNNNWFGGFFLSFWRLSPLLIAAVIFIAIAQIFFMSFAVPALENRYPQALTLIISASLYCLLLGAPIILLLGLGLASCELFRRTNSGFAVVSAHLVLNVGLLVSVSFLPWVRLFFF